MDETVKSIISAALGGDSVEVKNSVEKAIGERVAAQLEMKKIDIARGLVGQQPNMALVQAEGANNTDLTKIVHKSPWDKGVKKDNKFKKEDIEQIDELGKATLGSYAQKANRSIGANSHGLYNSKSPSEAGKFNRNLNNRVAGLANASKRLNKEDLDILLQYVREEFEVDVEDTEELLLILEEMDQDDFDTLMEDFQEAVNAVR